MTNKEHLVKMLNIFAETQFKIARQQRRSSEKADWECFLKNSFQGIFEDDAHSDKRVTYLLKLFYETVECNEILERNAP